MSDPELQEPSADSPLSDSPYSQAELSHLQEIFAIFDKDSRGVIELEDMQQLLTNLGKSQEEAERVLGVLGEEHREGVTFEAFVQVLGRLEKSLKVEAETSEQREESSGELTAPETKILDFLNLLEEYRRKCEEEGNYEEARKARAKYEELRKKESARQLSSMRMAQDQELQNVENTQKQQFAEFSAAWDNYMAEYEATAYRSLEKLKEKHMLEFQTFREKVLREARLRVKHSKELLELRKKEQTLAKQGIYDQAEAVKRKADQLEEWERARNESQVEQMAEKKEAQLRRQQQLALAALLKRIQRDRSEQLKHRQMDSQRLMQRNKNQLNDLLLKQSNETKRVLDTVKRSLGPADSSRKK